MISPARTDRQEFLDRQPTYWLKRAYGALRRRLDAELRPYGITLSQREALLALRHEGPLSVTALADHLGLEQSSASRLMLGLKNRGLSHVSTDHDDRRARRVALTDEGLRLLERTPGASRIGGGILNAVLTEQELLQLIELLRKSTDHLESLDLPKQQTPNRCPDGS